jgi:hypothetical protein
MSVATGVEGDADRAAICALLDMAAQRRGAARRDGTYDSMLDQAHVHAVSTAVSLAVAAEDIRHLKRDAHVQRSGWWNNL